MKKKIYYNNKIIGEITYQKYDRKSDKIIKVIQKNYPLLKDFFDFELSPIKIHLLYSRAEMNKHWGTKTPSWICGFVKGKNKIYILSPLISQKVSNHPESTIYKAIIHELVHLFVKKINKNPLAWLNEGLALVLAKQMKDNTIKKNDWDFLMKHNFITEPKVDWEEFENKSGYKASYILANFLCKNYKKDKIIKLLRINAKEKTAIKKLEEILNAKKNEFIKKIEKNINFI